MRCCGGQLQRTFGVSLSQGQTRGAFQCPCYTTSMPQTVKDFQGLAACGVGSQVISLLTVDGRQICQGPGGAPWVSGFPKRGKGTLIQLAGCSRVTLFARNVTLLVDRPGGPAAITEFLKDVRCLT